MSGGDDLGTRPAGKVGIVTGAAGYLGMSPSVRLARDGAKGVVTDIVDGQKTVDAVKGDRRYPAIRTDRV